MNLIHSDIMLIVLWILGTLLIYLIMEVSVIVNILKTDKEARLDALCDVEDYEYSKRKGLPVPPNLRGWDFRLRLCAFYWLYDDRFDFKEKINDKIINKIKARK